MDKKDARRLIINRLKNCSDENNDQLYHQLFSLNEWRHARCVSVTLSTDIEIPTMPIIHRAWYSQKKVVVPKVKPDRKMIFVPFNKDTKLRHDRFGILEPVSDMSTEPDLIDLTIVPGLAFTKAGDRLGFGGGYYDRYLKRYHGCTAGLARPEQLFDHSFWPVNPFDVKVDCVITRKGVARE